MGDSTSNEHKGTTDATAQKRLSDSYYHLINFYVLPLNYMYPHVQPFLSFNHISMSGIVRFMHILIILSVMH